MRGEGAVKEGRRGRGGSERKREREVRIDFFFFGGGGRDRVVDLWFTFLTRPSSAALPLHLVLIRVQESI